MMKNRILKFSILCAVLLTAGFRAGLSESRAATLHKLEYPNCYGCICCPNVSEFGYFRTQWRQWPCEERPDMNFPRSIGMERIPAPEGEKQVPLPKAPVTLPGPKYPGLPPGPEGGLPPPGLEEGLPPGEYLPPGPLPAQELPKEPPEPSKGPSPEPSKGPSPETPGGEFKPIPGLPPELETPAPLEPELPKKTNGNGNQPVSRNGKNVGRRGAAVEFRFVDVNQRKALPPTSRRQLPSEPLAGAPRGARLPVKPRANWNAALQPGADGERVRPSWYDSADDLARAAPSQESADDSVRAASGSEVVPQSYRTRADAETPPPLAKKRTSSSRPLALEGYCPVELARSGRWAEGHPQYSVVYRGQIYRFLNNKQRQKFLAAPEKYAPACDGRDPVILLNERRSRPGEVDYCAMYRGRIYLFSSGATQREFQRHPERYGIRDY